MPSLNFPTPEWLAGSAGRRVLLLLLFAVVALATTAAGIQVPQALAVAVAAEVAVAAALALIAPRLRGARAAHHAHAAALALDAAVILFAYDYLGELRWLGAVLFVLVVVLASASLPRRHASAVTAVCVLAFAGAEWMTWHIDLADGHALRADPRPGARLTVAAVVVGASLLLVVGALVRRIVLLISRADERHRLLLEAASEMIATLDAHGRLVELNAAGEIGLGCRREGVVGSTFERFVAPDDRALAAEMLAAALGGESQRFECRLVRADGAIIRGACTVTPILESTGRVTGVLCATRDVTEAHAAAAALRASEARYRSLVEATSHTVFTTDFAGRLHERAPRVEEFTGLSCEALRGHGFLEAIHLDDRARVQAAWARGLTTRSSYEVEHRMRRHDGEWRDTVARCVPILDADGRVVEWVGTHTDVTERRQAQAAAAASEAELRAVFDAMTDLVLVFDGQGRFLRIAPTQPNVLHRPATSMLGRSMHEVLPAANADQLVTVVREALARRSTVHCEYTLDIDGQEVWFAAAASPMGESDRVLWVARDITEQKRLETQFRQAQKMEAIGRLAGGVAHDFNNLLTAIAANGELALDELPASSPVRGDVQEILKAAARAADLTRQLLAFGRKQVLQPTVLDLNAVVADAEVLLQRVIGRDVTLVTALDPAAGAALADAGQIGQVLVNLAVNARDAMPGGGTLTVETANADVDAAEARAHKGLRPGPYATIVVRDNGCGMSAETQARIFEPFFTTKPAGQGTGLGLSTVYGIVKQSDGYIAVTSSPGGGTTFTIYLPRVAAGATAAADMVPGRGRRPAGRHETVLLVDDEATLRRSVRRMLERQGYAVIEAQHGADALLAWSERGGDVDLVLTDVIMPVMGGRELVERLRRAAPSVRVLFMSGYAGDAAATDGILAGGDAFMEKPFGIDDLARRIREVLDESLAA